VIRPQVVVIHQQVIHKDSPVGPEDGWNFDTDVTKVKGGATDALSILQRGRFASS
jgi:hypothetical protein